jgi:hypothetical protein
MCVCMYICVYICMYTCMYVCTYVCVNPEWLSGPSSFYSLEPEALYPGVKYTGPEIDYPDRRFSRFFSAPSVYGVTVQYGRSAVTSSPVIIKKSEGLYYSYRALSFERLCCQLVAHSR